MFGLVVVLVLASDQQPQSTPDLNGAPNLQERFAKDFVEGKFPVFNKESVAQATERLVKNPYSDSVQQDDQKKDEVPTKEKTVNRWWENKSDQEIAARFHMTPEQFRKASDMLLKWMDDRMSDLDSLYDQTVAIGKMAGVPVDHIINKEVSPGLAKWVQISQQKAGNPFEKSQREPDGHIFPNHVKKLITDFRYELAESRSHVNGQGGVDLKKLADLAQQMVEKSNSGRSAQDDDAIDRSFSVPGADEADKGFVFSPGAPTATLGLEGEAMRIMDDSVAPPDVNDGDENELVDVLDSTRGVFQ
eukprot:c13059_g1_i1.p1 GENE.c13059_g1_i1~~c13059_g1_i1.p1  ORF type:complete len:312 (-),score=92.71 c13059_g1_i1:90-998(-)